MGILTRWHAFLDLPMLVVSAASEQNIYIIPWLCYLERSLLPWLRVYLRTKQRWTNTSLAPQVLLILFFLRLQRPKEDKHVSLGIQTCLWQERRVKEKPAVRIDSGLAYLNGVCADVLPTSVSGNIQFTDCTPLPKAWWSQSLNACSVYDTDP